MRALYSILIGASVGVWLLACAYGCRQGAKRASSLPIQGLLIAQIDSICAALDTLEKQASRASGRRALQTDFKRARYRYKRVELVIEYHFQGLTKRINGAALPDVKTEDGQVLPPHGFQVLEELIFEGGNAPKYAEIAAEIGVLKADLRHVQKGLPHLPIHTRHAAQMIQHQLIRIATWGVTGFDSPVSLGSLEEAKHSLEGVHAFYKRYYEDSLACRTPEDLPTKHKKAVTYLQKYPYFEDFDRLAFLKDYLMPLSEAYQRVGKGFSAAEDTLHRHFFMGSLQDLMQGRGFQPDVSLPYADARLTPAKAALGKLLFYDTSLSKGGAMSCATCHDASKGFADGLEKGANLVHGGNLARNTPTLYYSGLQQSQFYDMRAVYLEDQIEAVMRNSAEFNQNPQEILAKIAQKPSYSTAIKQAFAGKFGVYELRNAIASYVRTLSPFSSRFDAYMRGETALNEEEKQGFNLFAGKARCATCHFIPLFNGTIPPWFAKTESEVLGVPQQASWANARIDTDLGRYAINAFEPLRYAFKTPTLRHIPQTAPYMHNGVYKTLEEVIRFYDRGGGAGIGIVLEHQTLPTDVLNLTTKEQKALLAFLHTLTERAEY